MVVDGIGERFGEAMECGLNLKSGVGGRDVVWADIEPLERLKGMYFDRKILILILIFDDVPIKLRIPSCYQCNAIHTMPIAHTPNAFRAQVSIHIKTSPP